MKKVKRSILHLAATAVLVAFVAIHPAHGDEVKIKIPVPPIPRIVLPAPPPMIWLPGISVYVAHESPYPIFAHQNHYYLHHENIWYIGPGYDGPWSVIEERRVPPGLRGFRQERWRDYETEADRRFREDHEERHYPYYADRPNERVYWKQHHDRGYERDRPERGYERRHDDDDDRRGNRHRDRDDHD
jgi:hypothetical protein